MKNKTIILITCLIILFFLNTLLVITNNYQIIDEFFINIASKINNEFLTNLFKIFTFLGEYYVIIIIVFILILIFKKNWRLILSSTVFTALFTQIIKRIVKRVRPNVNHLIPVEGFSYVSGHTTISIAVYGILIYLIRKTNIKKIYKNILTAFLIIIIICIPFSRIYLGVHYFSDIIGAYLISAIMLLITIKLFNKKC